MKKRVGWHQLSANAPLADAARLEDVYELWVASGTVFPRRGRSDAPLRGFGADALRALAREYKELLRQLAIRRRDVGGDYTRREPMLAGCCGKELANAVLDLARGETTDAMTPDCRLRWLVGYIAVPNVRASTVPTRPR